MKCRLILNAGHWLNRTVSVLFNQSRWNIFRALMPRTNQKVLENRCPRLFLSSRTRTHAFDLRPRKAGRARGHHSLGHYPRREKGSGRQISQRQVAWNSMLPVSAKLTSFHLFEPFRTSSNVGIFDYFYDTWTDITQRPIRSNCGMIDSVAEEHHYADSEPWEEHETELLPAMLS